MARLIILVSGGIGSGKNAFANLLAIEWLKRCPSFGGCERVISNITLENQELVFDEIVPDAPPTHHRISLETGVGNEGVIENIGFRIHGFSTILKLFLRDTMGIASHQLFGTQREKDTLTDLRWERVPMGVRWHNRKRWYHGLRKGPMTAREAMQIFADDLMRRWNEDVWVRATMSYAVNSVQKVVVIPDNRYPNEVEYARACRNLITHTGSLDARREYMAQHNLFSDLIDSGVVIKTVRLTRRPNRDNHNSEIALDHFPVSKFDVAVPPDADMERMREFAIEVANNWFNEAGVT